MQTTPMPARRILLTLEYDGTRYSGWQRQLNGPSVQEEVEKALYKALGYGVSVTGASRTDAGVHALGQRAHFDTASLIPVEKWPFVLNTRLPPDIRAVGALLVGNAFHARFSARGKEYSYRILNRRFAGALRHHYTAFEPRPLDVQAMERALASLPGRHDFAAFEASGGTARTTVRTIHEARLLAEGDELVLTLYGDAFLYNMVRIIAGTLMGIGLHKLPEDAFDRAIRTGDRLELGITAPAQGLTLVRVDYDLPD